METNNKSAVKYARKDSATGEGINEGFCVNDGDFYFSEESSLIKWLRGQNFITAEGTEANSLSDDDLKEWAYNDDIYYWTTWEVEENIDSYFDENGTEYQPFDYLKEWSREALIDWLCSNDRNGVYKDEDSLRELGNILSKDEAIELVTKQMQP